MSDDSIALARKGLAAYNAGDLEGLFELLHEDVVATVPPQFANEGVYEGRDGFRRMMFHWQEAWEQVSAEPLDYIVEGDCLIVPIRQVTRGRGSGVELETHFAYFIRVRDGLLREWTLFGSVDEALLQARAHPAP
jgi:ketosteroid isomerase-like protein